MGRFIFFLLSLLVAALITTKLLKQDECKKEEFMVQFFIFFIFIPSCALAQEKPGQPESPPNTHQDHKNQDGNVEANIPSQEELSQSAPSKVNLQSFVSLFRFVGLNLHRKK